MINILKKDNQDIYDYFQKENPSFLSLILKKIEKFGGQSIKYYFK